MKKASVLILSIIMILMYWYKVDAKDTLYTIGKYREEEFNFIAKSYNTKKEKDGIITTGKYLTNNEEKEDNNKEYKLFLNKYDSKGKNIWCFNYDEKTIGEIDSLTYTYDSEGLIDGYLISLTKVIETPNTDAENQTSKENVNVFLKIDLKGNKVFEKKTELELDEYITKIIPTYNESKEVSGYIAIARSSNSEQEKALLISYDKDLNILWKKEEPSNNENKVFFADLVNVYQDNIVVGYATILTSTVTEDDILLKYDKEGNNQASIADLSKYKNSRLSETTTGFILYGLTDEVKLKSGNYTSYIKKYDTSGVEEWETVGDIAINPERTMKILPETKEDKLLDYLLLSINANDSSIEVQKISLDGLVDKKIKKINNEYYQINDFEMQESTLYFTGFINCPEDDDCGYDTHSLLLVSDEDKVIEVNEKDNKNILIVTILFAIMLVAAILLRSYRKNKTSSL